MKPKRLQLEDLEGIRSRPDLLLCRKGWLHSQCCIEKCTFCLWDVLVELGSFKFLFAKRFLHPCQECVVDVGRCSDDGVVPMATVHRMELL